MKIEAAELITPNSRLTSLERLEIYSRSYWYRALDSLYDDFPGLRAVLGQQAFHRLSRAYVAECPSRSFTLRNLGERLAGWLQRNPQYAGIRHALALDMVRLEWASGVRECGWRGLRAGQPTASQEDTLRYPN